MSSGKVQVNRGRIDTHVIISGDFVSFMRSEIQEKFNELSKNIDTNIVIDMNKSNFMDSTGIGLIIRLYKQTQPLGFKMKLINVKGQPLSLLKMLEIDKFINVESTN